MGKSWDGTGVVHSAVFWTRMLRVLRPGAHALVWALPRTSHHTAMALEKAGFEIRDVHHHLFATGFPKSLDISLAIDSKLGVERVDRHTPATPDAARWTGYGSALKPAVEHWILARKPLAGTYADNVLTHGTGALNIDACRIGNETRVNAPAGNKAGQGTSYMMAVHGMPADAAPTIATGRWPAHLSLRHAPDCELVGTTTEEVAAYENVAPADRDGNATNYAMGKQRPGATHQVERDVYRCAAGCPVKELDEQSGAKVGSHGGDIAEGNIGYKDAARATRGSGRRVAKSAGGASRFFYVAKASRREKDAGLDHLPRRSGGDATDREDGSAGLSSPRAGAGRTGGARNHHCTTKSTALMRWLITLVVPGREALGRPGIVLDPFAGSGTTGVAALELGHDFVGCEQGGDSGEYWPILCGRIAHALKGGG